MTVPSNPFFDPVTQREASRKGNDVQIRDRKALRVSKNSVAKAFYDDVFAVWEDVGESALRRAAFSDPVGFTKMVASLMPKQLDVTTTSVNELENEQLDRLIDQLQRTLEDRSRPLVEKVASGEIIEGTTTPAEELRAIREATRVP
jgi:hypothetical protein